MVPTDIVIAGLKWLTDNSQSMVQLLAALVPVLALVVAGFAIYALVRHLDWRKKID